MFRSLSEASHSLQAFATLKTRLVQRLIKLSTDFGQLSILNQAATKLRIHVFVDTTEIKWSFEKLCPLDHGGLSKMLLKSQ